MTRLCLLRCKVCAVTVSGQIDMYTCDNMSNMMHVATITKTWHPFHASASSINEPTSTIEATQTTESTPALIVSVLPTTQQPYHAVAGSINELRSGNRGYILRYTHPCHAVTGSIKELRSGN